MKISFNWIKQYVNLPDSISAIEVAEKLKMATVEVEEVIKQGELLDKVVVGKILKIENHPQADKLKLTTVSVGNDNLSIVCGGGNLREGMLVALAMIGAKVKWHGEDKLIELQPTKIRGVESFGMICGATEIGLEDLFPPQDEREIIDLTDRVKEKDLGKPLADVLNFNDYIFEIDNKSLSNRPDLWGHYGMAREVATLFGKQLKVYETVVAKAPKKNTASLKIKVSDQKACPWYMAAIVDNVKISESPDWLKARLSAIGLRPINQVVDITNYILFDLGEPMHAFDASLLSLKKDDEKTKEIIVRKAESEEILTLLDGSEIKLDTDDLIIADPVKPLALAGIMGGKDCGVKEHTTQVIFEAANFEPSGIRRASIRHGIRTDASARFEKGLDPSMCQVALQKAIQMLTEFHKEAQLADQIQKESDYTFKVGPIIVEKNIFEKKLGVDIPEKEIKKILEQLGFELTDKGNEYSVLIPTWRATKDVSIAEDLVEEVIRIYGYEKMVGSLPINQMIPAKINPVIALEKKLRDILTRDASFDEVDNYAFISREQASKLNDTVEYLELDNPLSKEKPLLRRSLLPNLIENVQKNIEYFDRVAIYELGKVFYLDEPGQRVDLKGDELLPRQDVWLGVVYAEKKNQQPLMEIRRVLSLIAEEFKLDLSVETLSQITWQHAYRASEINVGEKYFGQIYELDPMISEKFGLSTRLGVMEINVRSLAEIISETPAHQYKPMPQYPITERDLAFVVDDKVLHKDLMDVLMSVDDLIIKVELFDYYQGDKLAQGKKSMAYRLSLSHPEKTLTSEEVESVVKRVIDKLFKKFNAEIRK